jgi:hypothetical protein
MFWECFADGHNSGPIHFAASYVGVTTFSCDIILGRVPFWLTFFCLEEDYVTAGGCRPRPFVFVPHADFAGGK